ncbi:very short patch repair endonuclease [Streptomyces sp. NBC_01465]|uniref:very short patch repair endonuclease n=1 Tax=Streptomyces sp. NBC_01465 TaxID=2903878 RepID=UPI002E336CB3|nr:very short patch repair endonuclease [Streptomyces sp. NBC_01465]
MSRQTSRDTTAERSVRQLLHASGHRYRIHYPVPDMPRRKIDIAFTRAKVAVLIDGCFWHGCPQHATYPKANARWWREKLDRNIARDRETTDHLRAAGWEVLRFWEHESTETVTERITASVESRRAERLGGKEPDLGAGSHRARRTRRAKPGDVPD